MEINSEIIEDIENIKKEIIELNNMIDKKCLDIYNENKQGENKILRYNDYLETIILEYHTLCKIMFSIKNNQ
jgi:hypothetical protein